MANPVSKYFVEKGVKPVVTKATKGLFDATKNILGITEKKISKNVVKETPAPGLELNYGVPEVRPTVQPTSTFITSAIPTKPVAPKIPTAAELGIQPRATEAEVKAFLIEKEPNINLNTKENKALVNAIIKADGETYAKQKVDYELTRRAIEREHARKVAEFEAALKAQPEFIPRAKTSKEMFEATTKTTPKVSTVNEPIKPNTTYMTEEQANIAEQEYARQLFEKAQRDALLDNAQLNAQNAQAPLGNVITAEDLAAVTPIGKSNAGNIAKTIGSYAGYGALSAAPAVTSQVTDNQYLNKAADIAGIVGNIGLGKNVAKSKVSNKIKVPAIVGSGAAAINNLINLFSSTPTKTDITTPETVDLGVEGGTTTPSGTLPPVGTTPSPATPGTTGTAPAVVGTTPQQAQVDALLQQSIDTQVAAITGGVTQKDVDDQATKQLNDLIKQYGDINKMYDSLVTGDPTLTATLASIQNQYQNSTAIINKAYDVATQQITGSTQAFSNQMKSAGEAQAAANALAAGGLGATVAPTGLTAEQASASGLSESAVGGGATTGSALVSALGGVGQSQQIADQLKMGAVSSDALQQIALDKAYAQTALEQNKLDAVTTAQINNAKTLAEQKKTATIYKANNLTNLADKVYATKAAQTAAKKQQAIDIAKIKADAAQTKAKYLLSMSKEEYQNFTGINASANLNTKPSFVIDKPLVGKLNGKVTKDPSAKVGITYVNSKGIPVNLTVSDANNYLSLVNASLTDPQALAPDTALLYWSQFFNKMSNTYPGFNDVLNKMKYPTSAQAMVNALYPAK